MSQKKLHSKLYQVDNEYMYFNSFDEQGENSKKGILPTYDIHLWRKKTR
jgi:hypothetical protein